MEINKINEQYNIKGSFDNWNYGGYLTRELNGSMIFEVIFTDTNEMLVGNILCKKNFSGIMDISYETKKGNEGKFTEYSNIVLKEILEYFS